MSRARCQRAIAPSLAPLAAVSFSLAAACGDDATESYLAVAPRPIERCEDERFTACNVYERSCQAAVFSATACLWGAGEDLPPPVTFITIDEYRELLMAAQPTGPVDDTPARVRGRSLALLELGGPDDFLPRRMQELLISTVPAYYDGQTVVFVEPLAPIEPRSFGELTVLLSHEFTHALQGKTIDWTQSGPRADTYDGRLASLSAFEGTAQVTAAEYNAALWGLDPKDVLTASHLTAWLEAFRSSISNASVLLGSNRYFPYTYGATYAYDAYLGEGPEGMHRLFTPMPTTTLEILWPRGEALPELTPVSGEPPPVPEGYELMQSDRLGAWVLHSFYERIGAPSTLSALPWRDDRLFAFHRGLDDVASVWRLRLEDADAAETLLDYVKQSALNERLCAALLDDTELTLVLNEDATQREAWSRLFPTSVSSGDAGAPDAGAPDAAQRDAGTLDAAN